MEQSLQSTGTDLAHLAKVYWQAFLQNAQKQTNTPRRWYLVGFVLMVLGVVLAVISDAQWSMPVISGIGIGAVCIGFLSELISIIRSLWSSSLAHKIAGTIVAAVLVPSCYIVARHVINEITSLAPEQFASSTPFIALIYAPLVVLKTCVRGFIAFAILMIFVLMWQQAQALIQKFASPFTKTPPRNNDEQVFFNVSRFIAAIALAAISWTSAGVYEDMNDVLRTVAKETLVYADYYERSNCTNVGRSERVAFLKDGNISVATPQYLSWKFSVKQCEQTLHT